MEQRFVEAESRMTQKCVAVLFFVCKKLSRKKLFIKLKNMTSSSKPIRWKLVGHYWTLLLKKIEDVPDCF